MLFGNELSDAHFDVLDDLVLAGRVAERAFDGVEITGQLLVCILIDVEKHTA